MDWRTLAKQPVGGREWKETIKRFSGDPALSAQYLPIARTLLGGLIQQLRLGGIEQGHRVVNLPDGSKIRVLHNSGINVVEITTFPTFVEEFGGSTSGGFIFYPRTDTVPYGIYTPTGPSITYPLVSDSFRPFSNLAYKYDEATTKYELTARAPSRTQSGNQFFFDVTGTCYSWWNKAKGDGPITVYDGKAYLVNNDDILYVPMMSAGTLVMFRYPFGTTRLYPIIYTGGNPWWYPDVDYYEHIAGFWCGEVTFSDDTTQTRYVIAIASSKRQRVRFIVGINPVPTTGTYVAMTLIPTEPEFVEWKEGECQFERMQWPVRFSVHGQSAATRFYDADDVDDYKASRFTALLLAEIGIEHTLESCVLTKTKETRYDCGMVKNSYKLDYNSNTTLYVRGHGVSTGLGDGTTTFESVYGKEYTEENPELPIGLTYEGNDLKLAFMQIYQPLKTGYTYYCTANYSTNIQQDVYGGTPFQDIFSASANYTSTGGAKLSQASGVLGIKLDDKVVYTVPESSFAEQELISNKTQNHNIFSSNTHSGFESSNDTIRTIRNDSKTKYNSAYYFVVTFFDIKRKILLSSKTESGYVREGFYDYTSHSYDNTNDVRTTGSSVETEAYRKDVYNGSAMFMFEYKDVDQFSQSFTTDKLSFEYPYTYTYSLEVVNYTPATPEITETGVFSYVDSPPMTIGASIERALLSYIVPLYVTTPSTAASFSDETEFEPVQISNYIEALFRPMLPMALAVAIDDRVSDRNVWAYSFYIDDVIPILNLYTGLWEDLPITFIQTNSTFGPLTQHIFLLDADENITDQPVKDSTLAVYPIGLY